MKNLCRTLSLSLLILGGCRTTKQNDNDMSDIKFAQGGPGFTHGHEALIFIGTVRAHEVIGDGFYDMEDMDDSSATSHNPMLWGSLTADFPTQARGFFNQFKEVQERYCSHFGFDAKVKSQRDACEAMPYSGQWQDMHFLRNWSADGKLDGAKSTCLRAIDRILAATRNAIAYQGQSYNDSANFWRDYWAGVAVHTIQDSFSEAHVVREGADRRKLTQVCHYNKDVVAQNPGICAHKTPFDNRDIIWTSVPPAFEVSAFEYMTEAGKQASLATKAYLVHLANLIRTLPSGQSNAEFEAYVRGAFKPYFADASLGEGYGYMNCSTLSD